MQFKTADSRNPSTTYHVKKAERSDSINPGKVGRARAGPECSAKEGPSPLPILTE